MINLLVYSPFQIVNEQYSLDDLLEFVSLEDLHNLRLK